MSNGKNTIFRTMTWCVLGSLLIGIGTACSKEETQSVPAKPVPAAKPTAAKTVSFNTDVLPVFERKCVACHSADKAKAPKGLGLTRETAAATLAPEGRRTARMYLNKKTNSQVSVLPETAADAATCGLAVKLSKGKHATYVTDAEKTVLTTWLAIGAPLTDK